MDFSEKIIDKKEEILYEFENLSLEEISKKIKEIDNLSEKIVFIEREINRLGNIKVSEDTLNIAIDMARLGNSKEEIIEKTGLTEDEVEAIYTYYKK